MLHISAEGTLFHKAMLFHAEGGLLGEAVLHGVGNYGGGGDGRVEGVRPGDG